jgi:hypothetical protein
MEITVDTEKLKGTSIFIGVPAYGNMVTTNFTHSLMQLSMALAKWGVQHEVCFLGNESLVTRARNVIANNFYSDRLQHSHLLFLDADLGFDANDVLAMVALDKELIGLPYSKKSINWRRVAEAAKKGVSEDVLPNVSAAVVVNWAASRGFHCDALVEVNHIGTGLMLIQRSVFTKLADAHPDWIYNLMEDEVKGSRKTSIAFFDTGIQKGTGHYLSEDYKFCSDWKDLGGQVWLLPSAKTSHLGTYAFQCDIPAIANAGLKL